MIISLEHSIIWSMRVVLGRIISCHGTFSSVQIFVMLNCSFQIPPDLALSIPGPLIRWFSFGDFKLRAINWTMALATEAVQTWDNWNLHCIGAELITNNFWIHSRFCFLNFGFWSNLYNLWIWQNFLILKAYLLGLNLKVRTMKLWIPRKMACLLYTQNAYGLLHIAVTSSLRGCFAWSLRISSSCWAESKSR